MLIKETALFRCPIERLWDHIEQPEKQKLWMKGLLSNESTSPAKERVGATFRMVIHEGRKAATYDGEVTAHEKPYRLEVIFWGGNLPPGSRMRVDYRLHETTGQTRLDYVATLEGAKFGLFLRLLFPLFKLFGRMQLRRFFRTLRQLVETPALAA